VTAPTISPTTTSAATSGASESGNTVTIRTAAALPASFVVGASIAISGVDVAGYNGNFTITSVAGSTFTYSNPTAGLGLGGGGKATVNGATIIPTATVGATGATEVGNTVTITTTAAHGFSVGQTVVLNGLVDARYNGTFTITAVTANTFPYTNPVSGLLTS